MYISRHEIGDLYNQRLLLEMKEDVVDHIMYNYDPDDLPFNFLFKDKMRLVIPVYQKSLVLELLKEALTQIKDFDHIDKETGEVVRKIKLDAKYGGGFKEQRMNLGTAISKLSLPEDTKKRFLNWYALYKNNIKDALSGKSDQYVAVISRHPIDIVRMSDFGSTIESCHSRGREYFYCAVKESIEGGGVAYLVRYSDWMKYKDTLQDEDFFQDDDRGEGNVWPLARLRIRRLLGQEHGEEFAIPDYKIYGDYDIPGFKESVRKFLRAKQPVSYQMFLRKNYTDPLKHIGGDYKDHSIPTLVDVFFGNKELTTDKELYHSPDYGFRRKDRRYGLGQARNYVDELDYEDSRLDDAINVLDGARTSYEISHIETENNLAVSYDFNIQFGNMENIHEDKLKDLVLNRTLVMDLNEFWKSFLVDLDLQFTNDVKLINGDNFIAYHDSTLWVEYDLGLVADQEDANQAVRICHKIDEGIDGLESGELVQIFIDNNMYEDEFVKNYSNFSQRLDVLNDTHGWAYEKTEFSVSTESPDILLYPNFKNWSMDPYDDMVDIFFNLLMNFTKIHFEPISQHKEPEQLHLSLQEAYNNLYHITRNSSPHKYFRDFLEIRDLQIKTVASRDWGYQGISFALVFDFLQMTPEGMDWLEFINEYFQSVEHLLEFAILIEVQKQLEINRQFDNVLGYETEKNLSYVINRHHQLYTVYSKYL